MNDGDWSCCSTSKNPSNWCSVNRVREGIISLADSTPSCRSFQLNMKLVHWRCSSTIKSTKIDNKRTMLFWGVRLISWAISKDFRVTLDCSSLRASSMKGFSKKEKNRIDKKMWKKEGSQSARRLLLANLPHKFNVYLPCNQMNSETILQTYESIWTGTSVSPKLRTWLKAFLKTSVLVPGELGEGRVANQQLMVYSLWTSTRPRM